MSNEALLALGAALCLQSNAFAMGLRSFVALPVEKAGTGSRRDTARYDLSWQHRLVPALYPEWGIQAEWHSVVELGGRWRQGDSVVHQLTLGLQWTQRRWVLEGGIVQDLNGTNSTGALLSIRFH